ncbi:MAG: hypothetical protein AB8B73_14755 [Ekhidna sp.]
MKKVYNYMILAGVALMAISCATPEDPTPTQMTYGSWSVEEHYVNGQADAASDPIIEKFILEIDGTFLLEDNNGILFVGDWAATETSLTLSQDGVPVFEYEIVFQAYDRMQLLQTIGSPTAGTIEIRYLMSRDSDPDYE